jgi:hypothetical protein
VSCCFYYLSLVISRTSGQCMLECRSYNISLLAITVYFRTIFFYDLPLPCSTNTKICKGNSPANWFIIQAAWPSSGWSFLSLKQVTTYICTSARYSSVQKVSIVHFLFHKGRGILCTNGAFRILANAKNAKDSLANYDLPVTYLTSCSESFTRTRD